MLNRKTGDTDQGAHVSGDSKPCSCGDPHAAFTPPDIQRRPAKHKKNFLHVLITLQVLRGESGSCSRYIYININMYYISNTSCVCGVMLCINQYMFPCILSYSNLGKMPQKYSAIHPRKDGSVTFVNTFCSVTPPG